MVPRIVTPGQGSCSGICWTCAALGNLCALWSEQVRSCSSIPYSRLVNHFVTYHALSCYHGVEGDDVDDDTDVGGDDGDHDLHLLRDGTLKFLHGYMSLMPAANGVKASKVLGVTD